MRHVTLRPGGMSAAPVLEKSLCLSIIALCSVVMYY